MVHQQPEHTFQLTFSEFLEYTNILCPHKEKLKGFRSGDLADHACDLPQSISCLKNILYR